jgi:hypothetical protein
MCVAEIETRTKSKGRGLAARKAAMILAPLFLY